MVIQLRSRRQIAVRRSIVLCSLAVLGACATQGTNTYNYSPPTPVQVRNEITIGAPYGKVWDVLVRELAKSFYVINNIDKESRIVNVSFTSTQPNDFIDCGRSSRTYVEGDKVERFDYDVASRSSFKVAAQRQEHPAFTNYGTLVREPTLEGRSNIYVAPVEGDPSKTTVSVNTRYVLTIRVRGEAFARHISGNVQSRGRIPENTTTVSFNTGSVGTHEEPNFPTLRCSGRGKLENEVLAFVRSL